MSSVYNMKLTCPEFWVDGEELYQVRKETQLDDYLSIYDSVPLKLKMASGADGDSNQWSQVTLAPPDAILGLSTAFKNDTDPKKVNLGIGAYRTENGDPYVFPVVREAEKAIVA